MKCLSILALAAVANLAHANSYTSSQTGPYFGSDESCVVGTPILTGGWLSVQPMPFCPEGQYSVGANGNVSEPIVQGATINVSAKVNGKVVYTDSLDYCKLLSIGPLPCPVPVGNAYNLMADIPTKSNLPNVAGAEWTFSAKNANGNMIFCRKQVLKPGTLGNGLCTPPPPATTTSAAPKPTPSPIPMYPISSNCADGSNPLQTVTDFALTPSDFCVGKNYTITLTGPLSGPIVSPASMSITGRFLNNMFYSDQVPDLCQSLAEAGTPCPVAASTTSLSIQRQLKANLPPNIPLKFQFSATNGDGQVIFCRSTFLKGKTC